MRTNHRYSPVYFVLAFFSLIAFVLVLTGCSVPDSGDPQPVVTVTETAEPEVQEEPVEEVAPEKQEKSDEVKTEVAEEAVSSETEGQANAREKAEDYLSWMAFSKAGLKGQLEFDGYTAKDAKYAVNHIDVDWNEQAVRKAEEYLEFLPMSKPELQGQLEFDKFTKEQAAYGVAETL